MLFLVACAVVLASTSAAVRLFPGVSPALFIGFAASVGAFGLTMLFVWWDGLRLGDVGARFTRDSAQRLLVGLALGALLVALHTGLVSLAGYTTWERVPPPRMSVVLITAVAFMLLACREELAFHGYPLRRLVPTFGVWGAQAMIAFLFALEHVAGGVPWRYALLGAGVGSLLFGMASIATRGLAMPIGMHAAWNIGDWMRGGKGTGGLWRPVIRSGFADRSAGVDSALYIVVTVSATAALWWWWRRTAGIRAVPAPASSETGKR